MCLSSFSFWLCYLTFPCCEMFCFPPNLPYHLPYSNRVELLPTLPLTPLPPAPPPSSNKPTNPPLSGFGGSSFHWDDVRDPIMQAPGDLLMVLDCSAAPGIEHPEIRMEAGLIPSPSTKQLLGVCAPYSYSGMAGADNFMTKSLCRALDGDVAGLEEGEGRGLGESGDGMGTRMVSVQGLCGAMKGYLRREGIEGSTVFVTQLGGGQLMDIYLPRL